MAMRAPTVEKPWLVLPSEKVRGGLSVFTYDWATLAVLDWRAEYRMVVLPITDSRTPWTRWELDSVESYSLSRDLVTRQSPMWAADDPSVLSVKLKEFGKDVARAMNFSVHRGGLSEVAPRAAPQAKPTLYYIYATGCDACRVMKPILRDFYQRNKDRVNVVPVDLASVEWKAKKWVPDATPTLILRFPDGRLSEPLEGYEDGRPKETLRNWFLTAMQKHRHGA